MASWVNAGTNHPAPTTHLAVAAGWFVPALDLQPNDAQDGYTLLLMIGLTLTAAIAIGTQATAKIEDLRFMAGAWKCEIWGGTFDEYWTPPAAGAMQGSGRHIADGKTAFMEFMSIESGPDGLTMYMILGAPSKGDKKPVPFKLTSFDGKTALFENPKNDFPSKIAYVKERDGMSCWIEGIQDGKKTKEDFKFKRMN